MARLMPSATDLALQVLDAAVAPVPVRSLMPDLSQDLPVVMARRGGGSVIDPRALDSAIVTVQCWHTSDKAAEDLAEECRGALYAAWRQQTVTSGAAVSGYGEQSAPVLLPSEEDPKGTYRYVGSYELAIRAA